VGRHARYWLATRRSVKQALAMAGFVGLLRGINVGGHARLPMAALREICAGLGWEKVETYIQSGNFVFEAEGREATLEAALEAALPLRVPVLVRAAPAWRRLVAANPFAAEAQDEAQRVLTGLSKRPPAAGAAAAIEAKAAAGERVLEAGGALWFHYPEGVGTSKLTPALIDRAAGSPVTARNWRTLQKLEEMLG
jgi:uncharacterized protein (DUF1697 family)